MKTSAKRLKIAATAILFSFAGCNEITKEDQEQTASIKADYQIQQLAKEKALNDSVQLSFAQTLNEIDQNLDLIREKQGVLVLGPGSDLEPGISMKEHIQRNISIINALMAQNQEKLQKLGAQLKKSKASNALLTKLTEGTRGRILIEEGKIEQLKKQLIDKSFEMEKLSLKMNDVQLANAILQDKAEQLDEKVNVLDKDMHRAYYAVGSYRELQKQDLMTKEGGVLGIGKKKILKGDFKKDCFTAIDERQTTYIPVFARKLKLVTFHPKDSYELTIVNDKITYLEIKNPEEFWKASRFLVVEVEI